MVWRSTEISKKGDAGNEPVNVVVLAHDQRHIRRKLLHLANGDMVMLDLKEPVHLENGDRLLLDDGNQIEVVAAEEELLEIVASSQLHIVTLAWHLGNRHLPAQIEESRILILRDHVIAAMLEGLGASLRNVVEPFHPAKGAYHDHASHKAGHAH